MSFNRSLLACLAAALIPQAAFALATEHFGNAPIRPEQWGISVEVATVANLPSRVYWYEVNGSPSFYYRGDMAALNAALREFAELPGKDKQIRLTAGPGETKDLQQKKVIPFDWNIRLAGVLEQAVSGKQPVVMTVHVTVPRPTEKPDEDAVKRLITDLDSPVFATREAAGKKLRDLSYSGVPYFKAALKTTESAEVRQRLEGLLSQLKGVYLPLVELPPGVAVVGPRDLYEQHVKGLSDPNAEARGRAVQGLVNCRGSRADVVKELEKFLGQETNEYALRCAASATTRLGADAKPLLPALKKQLASPDANVKQAFASAVKAIAEAKPAAPSTDDDKRIASLETEIQQTLKELRGTKK